MRCSQVSRLVLAAHDAVDAGRPPRDKRKGEGEMAMRADIHLLAINDWALGEMWQVRMLCLVRSVELKLGGLMSLER